MPGDGGRDGSIDAHLLSDADDEYNNDDDGDVDDDDDDDDDHANARIERLALHRGVLL